MESIAWISGVFLVYLTTFADAGPKCFECTRVPFPRDCNHVTECGEHEVCHTMQVVSRSGHVFYDTGCLDSTKCGTKRMVGFDSSLRADDEAGDLITCTECCHGDYCNSQGCGTTPLQPFPGARGPLCFNCPKGTVAPEHCEMVTVCSTDECQDISGIFIGKRATTPCKGCCKSDFCNQDCSSISSIAMVTTLVSSLFTPTRQVPSSTTYTVTPTSFSTNITTSLKSPTSRLTTVETSSIATEVTSRTVTRLSTSSTYSHTQVTVSPTTHSEHTKELQCLLMGYEYLKSFHHCVKPYKNLQLTWQDARDRCIQDGGDLLIFHNKPEESYFESWLKNMTGTESRYWVGASDLLQEGTWQWVDSTAVDTKLYFYTGEPNDAEKQEDCAAATYHPDHHVLLNDDNCDVPSNFICEANLTGISEEHKNSSQKYCRNSGYRYDSQHGICFKVYRHEMKTMADARASCQKEHADLLQLRDTETETYFLHQAYDTEYISLRRFWLGATRHADGQFYWFNEKQMLAKDYVWGIGEPNNYHNNHEDCLSFWHYPGHFLNPDRYALNDDNCELMGYYICEERCPDKSYTYVEALDLCFKIYTSAVTWDQARNKCLLDHAGLAEPNTVEKIDFFHKYLTTLGTPKYWIGGKQSLYDPRTFIWQTSQQAIAREVWHAGEPNNLLEQCASLYWYNREGLDGLFRINDLQCDFKNPYICQYIW